jgi:hypothetical protein
LLLSVLAPTSAGTVTASRQIVDSCPRSTVHSYPLSSASPESAAASCCYRN